MGRYRFALAIAIAMALACGPAQAQMLVPHQEAGSTAPDFTLFPFWQKVLADMRETAVAPLAAQPDTTPGMLPIATVNETCSDLRHCVPPEWTQFLAGLRDKPAREQIEAVNRWANARPYVEDMTNWFLPDYWATPGEFLAKGGDCEDFAIIKYFSLVRLGFAPDRLRIAVVADTRDNGFHAVLTVQQDGESLVLDNFLAEVTPQKDLSFYRPVYALNEEGWQMQSVPVIRLAHGAIVASLR